MGVQSHTRALGKYKKQQRNASIADRQKQMLLRSTIECQEARQRLI